MKIEIGESLIASWLKHIEKCQVVQLNWKPSTSFWQIDNYNEIEKVINYAIDYFEKEYGGLSDARNYGLDRAKGHYIT